MSCKFSQKILLGIYVLKIKQLQAVMQLFNYSCEGYHSGCNVKEATAIERTNILEFTKSCNRATQRLFKDLLRKFSK